MKLTNRTNTKTKVSYTLSADQEELNKYRLESAQALAETVNIPGFRAGKAPADMVAKQVDQNKLQDEFLNRAINALYLESRKMLDLRIIGEPKITITKFVPFSDLEVSVKVAVLSDIKLPTYASLRTVKNDTKVTPKQLELALSNLQKRAASLKPVKSPAKNGNLVIIGFEGLDTKTKEKLAAASAEDYRLLLGDNTLIPGFEDKIVGMIDGKSKTFDLTFPKDYPDKAFASRQVTFKVTLKEVNDVTLPRLDDQFASTIGPFATLDELKAELKKEIQAENERQATIEIENKILNALAEKTVVELDDGIVQSEADMLMDEARRSCLNRGQTWQEFLAGLGQSEEEYTLKLKETAKNRIKAGLAVGEIANKENISVSDHELEERIANLKKQYLDPKMQEELSRPENQRELAMRLLTAKVLDFIQTKTNTKST
jgi:trigger factor